jgi:hypothetical protein
VNIFYLGSADQGRYFVSSDGVAIRLWDAALCVPIGPAIGIASYWGMHAVRQDVSELFVAYSNGRVLGWPIESPVTADASMVMKMAETRSGRRLQDDGGIRLLSPQDFENLTQTRRPEDKESNIR